MSRKVLTLAVLVASVALGGCGVGAAGSEAEATPTEDTRPPLEAAKAACAPTAVSAKLGDEGSSLMLDGSGKDKAGLTTERIACILTNIGTPDHVISRMDSTRALDGMQDAEWDGYTASWTYHPDNGLDVILTHTPEGS